MRLRNVRASTAALALIAALGVALATSDCHRGPSAERQAARSTGADGDADGLAYPAGAWWRANLHNVSLPFGHILIRYDRAEPEPRLRLSRIPSSRSWDDAVRLARSIAEKARTTPERFEALAAAYSEDGNTSSLGGAMGAPRASSLPAAIVDALGHLREGEVSHVVRTRAGLHVLKRLPPPVDETVEGRTILIRCQSGEDAVVTPRPVVRSCEQARQFAEDVAAKARASPADFALLAAQHSDSWGGRFGGDFGRWSTREAADDALGVEVLRRLEPQGVSHVIEDPTLGFRIFERTSRVERQTLAFSAFILSSQDVSDTFPRTRAEAKALAADLLKALEADPSRFDAVRRQYCDYDLCRRDPVAYEQGRGSEPEIDSRLPDVPIGAILPEVVETSHGMLVVRREDPTAHPPRSPPALSYTLPRPAPKGLLTASSDEVQWYLQIYTRTAISRFALHGDEARGFAAIMGDLGGALKSASPKDRQALTDATWKRMEGLFGAERADQLEELNANLMLAVQSHRSD